MSLRTLVAFIKENVDQTHTKINNTGLSMEHGDAAYAWLKTNHPDVHQLIRYDAQVPIDPVQTIKAIKSYS